MPDKEDRIRRRAYYLYQMRIKYEMFGNTLSDWLIAEAQVEHEDYLGLDKYVFAGKRP